MLFFHKLRCVILQSWLRESHFDGIRPSQSRNNDCHAKSLGGRVQCFKMAKKWPSLTFFLILQSWLRESHFDGIRPSQSRNNDCHAKSLGGRVQCFKMAKKWPSLTFLPHLLIRKATLQWANLLESKKISKKMEPLGFKYLLLCV